ncbi:FxLD family lanthipeptide [Streptosporangium sp. NBC_01755]|uniref:FxLD family lanthipeptide n=1 Tax=unclassified Streptosporangium TaxID=2632669 RepID=UPI002DDAA80C|nr:MULTISPECIES: FxLD family lanthipeptide [unclassified Streptosporangium]WSA25917.1 FxLD family lanthipeptide [Streptosporangium sp. NBC_01810]WSD02694.1 FxLD family lanthipeptide [Streptosporangium sp. NBC_01755]
MNTQTIARSAEPRQPDTDDADDPFQLDIAFIENTPATDTVLMCSTGDNCGTSCPSACPTS